MSIPYLSATSWHSQKALQITPRLATSPLVALAYLRKTHFSAIYSEAHQGRVRDYGPQHNLEVASRSATDCPAWFVSLKLETLLKTF